MSLFIKIFEHFLTFLSKIVGKKILYTSFESLSAHENMAILEPKGFWYVGNLYDSSDIAYGIANESAIQSEGNFVESILRQIDVKKDKRVFYDIGANTGYFGILAMNLSQGGTVSHFFEPLDEHVNCIKKSLYLNRFEEQSFIHQIGVGNENTTKTFYIAGSGSSLVSGFSGFDVTGTCSIMVKRLDDYQKENDLPFPDFVKIDVEGNEYDVIAGGISLFSEAKPVLYVEIAKDLKNIGRDFVNPHFDEIFNILEGVGYRSFRVSDDYKQVTKFIPGPRESGVHMYLFLHGEKHGSIISQYTDESRKN